MFKRILVAVDEGGPAARAVEVASGMAEQLGARMAVMHVVDSSRAFVPELARIDEKEMARLKAQGTAILNAARMRVPPILAPETLIMEGDPAECIISTAKNWEADLVVMGSDSRGRLAHFLLGSTADSVIRRAPCPVVTVRMSAAPHTEEKNRVVATA